MAYTVCVPCPILQKLLESGLSCLIFASEIDHGYWVRNGRVMRSQRNHYVSSHLAPIDLEMVQFAVKIIGYLETRNRKMDDPVVPGTTQTPGRCITVDGDKSDDPKLKLRWNFDPFCKIFSDVFR